MQSRASNSLDLVVTISCGLTLQICLIIACHFTADVGGLALSMAKSHWHGALRSAQELYMRPRVLKDRWRELVATPLVAEEEGEVRNW